MRDLYNHLTGRRALSPVASAADTPLVSQIIDRQGFDSLVFFIATGTLGDADATFTVLVEDGDNSALSDNAAVADAELNGTEAAASFTFANDDVVKKIGYIGSKRYVRMTITPANNGTAGTLGVIAVLGNASIQPNGA